jgi:hypothetical protein
MNANWLMFLNGMTLCNLISCALSNNEALHQKGIGGEFKNQAGTLKVEVRSDAQFSNSPPIPKL